MPTRFRTVLQLLSYAGVAALIATAVIARAESPAAGTPIVVELFTSQGCSSCPPADRLLTRLGREGLPGGVEVIPLSFHVDYWNYIGWTDPFSSRAWSDRQRRYALVMEEISANAELVLREIARARSRRAAVAVEIDVDQPAADLLEAKLATRVDDAIPGHGLELMVALFEKRLVTPVSRGENAARTLENDYVVRSLEPAFEISGHRGTSQSGSVVFQVDPAWQRRHLGLAAFAQDPASLAIYGAASRPAG